MKAESWEFRLFLPDSEDIEAGLKAAERYFSLSVIPSRNSVECEIDAFHAGFNRGIAWAAAKADKQTDGRNGQ